MKIAISLPNPLFEAADRLASELGISRSELFQRAMERLLHDYDDTQVTASLNRIYADQPSLLDPALASAQLSSLPREAW